MKLSLSSRIAELAFLKTLDLYGDKLSQESFLTIHKCQALETLLIRAKKELTALYACFSSYEDLLSLCDKIPTLNIIVYPKSFIVEGDEFESDSVFLKVNGGDYDSLKRLNQAESS